MFQILRQRLGVLLCVGLAVLLFVGFMKYREYANFKKVISHLKADSRAAEVLVTASKLDEATGRFITTIKFLEYDVDGNPVKPKYFTFRGNEIQFQSLVVRFEDEFVEAGHPFKGKSVYLFLKAFVLNGSKTQEFLITELNQVPDGYNVEGISNRFQRQIWENFWDYALDSQKRKGVGVKNAQLEAPGSVFVPGTIYTIQIEHDGGLRIDTKPIPAILRGETIT